MISLAQFSTQDMLDLMRRLPDSAADARTMNEAAGHLAVFLRNELVDETHRNAACALVRIYTTHPMGALPARQQAIARQADSAGVLNDEIRCLTLLGTAGDRPEWNNCHESAGHQAIPLVSADAVRGFPMVARLFEQLGVGVASVLAPTPDLMIDPSRTAFNVFHVAEALGSPYIPAQDFVRQHGVRSVIGFGGRFMSGEICATIMFSKVAVGRPVAERFRALAPTLMMALMPFSPDRVFVA